jgi:two-component system chemotaxis response regulator CheB
MIVIGASLGGLKALQIIIRRLPDPLPVPVVVVLHRHKDATEPLAPILQGESTWTVSEAVDKEPIRPARIYLAPPDYHLHVESDHFSLSTDEPVNHARPSIDVLFESAAEALGPKVIGVILTGASSDGARGASEIKRCGGQIVVQDPASAECRVMPAAAIESTGTAHVKPLDQIAETLIQLTKEIRQSRSLR